MKIAIISGGIKSHISKLSYKHILEDLKYIYDLNSKHAYVKHIDIGDFKDNLSIVNESFNVFGIPSKKEIILPLVDIVIDTTHHYHSQNYSYSNRLGLPCLFKKNTNRLHLKSILEQINLTVNSHINNIDTLDFYDLVRSVHLPSVIKSSNFIVPTFIGHNHKEIFEYIAENKEKDDIFVENYIRGKVYVCIFIKNFRGQDVYNSFIFEQIKKQNDNFSYSQASHVNDQIKDEIKNIGKKILLATDSNICEISFIIKDKTSLKNKIYSSDIIVNNCIFSPRYFPGTPFFEILKAHGISILELVDNFRDKK